MRRFKIVAFLILIFTIKIDAQDRFTVMEEELNQLARSYPGLDEAVDLSMNGVTIQEYIRAIASTNNLNVNVDPTLDIKLTTSFNKVSAKDIFIFLCKRYDLDILFVGPIMTFVKYNPPPLPEPVKLTPPPKKINVTYESLLDLISFDLAGDTLSRVTREITRATGKNIVFSSELMDKTVSGFVQNASLNAALEKLAFANDMNLTKTADDFYVFQKGRAQKESFEPVEQAQPGSNSGGGNKRQKNAAIQIVDGLISMNVQNLPIVEIVSSVSQELDKNFFLFSEIKGTATLKVVDATYDDFLRLLFNGTDLTFKKENSTYLIGDRNLEGLRQSKLITLQNRTIEKVIDFIPAELKKGLEIKVFEDLNGIIASGSQPRINEIESFLRQLDLVVPMVHIEVIIADVRKSNSLSAGISAGLGTKQAVTSGTLVPEYNVTLNSQSINNLIKGINGFGVINLGAVTPNFYINLKAMESSGILKLRSTPQIATLNGHEAKLSIGQTQYYLEVNNNIVNTNPTQQNLFTQSRNWKPVNADLSITLDPQISGDEQVTMTINVKQSSFTERVEETAPPGTINRDFQSLVRVKNGEMIMLGGLEENENNTSGKGLPFLSRIPVIRWFFGERTKSKRESKLTIFIKPTIIYG